MEGRVDEARSLAPGPFDPVYITQGPICWLPDLKIWANAIATVLAPGEEHYFADAHPSFMLMEERGISSNRPTISKRPPSARWSSPNETTYTGDPTVMKHQSAREWIHPLSAILGRYQDVSRTQGPPLAGIANDTQDGYWRLPDGHPRFPLSMSLPAQKEK